MTEPAPTTPAASDKDRLLAAAETLQARTAEINDLLLDLLALKVSGQRSSNNWLIFQRTFLVTLVIGGLLASLITYGGLQGFRSDSGSTSAPKTRACTSIIST